MSYERAREVADRLRASDGLTAEGCGLVAELLASHHYLRLENDYLRRRLDLYSGGPDATERLRQGEQAVARVRGELRISERARLAYRERTQVWYGKYLAVKHENNKLRAKLYRQGHRRGRDLADCPPDPTNSG